MQAIQKLINKGLKTILVLLITFLLLMALIFLGIKKFIFAKIPWLGGGTSNTIETIVTPWGTIKLGIQEVKGQEPDCLPKEKHTKRIVYNQSSSDNEKNVEIVYYAEGKSYYEDIKNHYINNLKECGFQKTDESEMNFSFQGFTLEKGYEANFEKGNASVNFSIAVITNKKQEFTIVDINYTEGLNNENEGEGLSTTENSQDNDTNSSFESLNEATPTDEKTKAYAAEYKAILRKLFGDAKLESSLNTGALISLNFRVRDTIESKGVQQLKDYISQQGYTLNAETSDKNGSVLYFTNPPKVLTVNIDYNTNEIAITIKE